MIKEYFVLHREVFLMLVACSLVCFFVVLLLVCIDFVFGVLRSRRCGVPLNSKALRRSVSKLLEYWCLLLLLSVIGGMFQWTLEEFGFSLPKIPFVTFITTIVIGLIELKSVMENVRNETKKNAKDLVKLFSSLDDMDKKAVIKRILDYLVKEEGEL